MNLKIYKASAGSGKTYTLVREYLCLTLVHPERYRSVLAITFTNKAAGEMKERIIRSLKDISAGQAEELLAQIAESTGAEAGALRQNATRALALILHDYGNFAVRTIDSFMHRLVRQFAGDLDLPSKFDVETDTTALLERMSDRLMDAIGTNPYVTRILLDFIAERLKDENGWQVERDITSVSRELVNEAGMQAVGRLQDLSEDDFFAFIEWLKTERKVYPEAVSAAASEALSLVEQAGLEDSDFKGGRYSLPSKLRKLKGASSESPKEIRLQFEKGSLYNAFAEDEWCIKGKMGTVMPLVDSGLRSRVRALFEIHERLFGHFLTVSYAYEHVHSLAVLREIEDLLESYKSDHQVVLIQDFQRKVADFISGEAPDYIYWRLGERYRHFLIDEFQDTSLVQWGNLWPLFEYVQSEPEREGSLLLVGDSKQAIYRWRGGETALLEQMAPAALDTEPIPLEYNFRSGRQIIEFNNSLYSRIREIAPDATGVKGIYQGFEQEVGNPAKQNFGFVRVEFLEGKPAEFKEAAIANLVGNLQSLRAEGYAWRDCAVLVRRREEGSQVAAALSAEGIPFLSMDSLQLYKEPSVAFLISLFRFLNDPTEALARSEVMHYHFAYLRELDPLEVSVRLRQIEGADKPWRAVMDELPEALRKLNRRLDRMPLYELSEECIRIFGLNKRNGAYVQQFLDVVLQYAQRRKPDLAGFLEYWEEKKGGFAVVSPPGEDAVEIMTIHKAKGLEFPVVFLPFVNWRLQPPPDGTFWASTEQQLGGFTDTFLVKPQQNLLDSEFSESYREELEQSFLDNVNMLYVATTRPRDRLFIYAPERHEKKVGLTGLEDIRTSGDLLYEAMNCDTFAFPEPGVYEAGFPDIPPVHAQAPGLLRVEEMPSYPWRDRLKVERRFRRHWDSGSEETGMDPQLLLADMLRQARGPEDLPRMTATLVEEGLCDAETAGKLNEKAMGFFGGALGEWLQPPARLLRGDQVPGILPEFFPDLLLLREGCLEALMFSREGELTTAADQLLAWLHAAVEAGFDDARAQLLDLENGEFIAVG